MNNEKKKNNMVDLAVLAANLGSNIVSAEAALSDPLIVKALSMTTDRSLAELATNPEALAGALNTAKGKYFELLVAERLNAGDAVGDIVIKADQHAQLADSINQPGWDIAVLDKSNHVVDQIQLKATESSSYIAEALHRYPDIKILATSEAANLDHAQGLVLDSGLTNNDIQDYVGDAIDYGANGSISIIDAFNPLFPLVFIMATEGYKVVLGKGSVEMAMQRSVTRASHSLTGAVIGSAFQAMGFGWFSIVPAILAARAGPSGLIKAVEDAASKIQKGYESAAKNERETRSVRNQKFATDQSARLQKAGSSRILSENDVQRMRPVSTGLSLIDDIALGFAAAVDSFNDPEVKAAAVKQFKDRQTERQMRKEAKQAANLAQQEEFKRMVDEIIQIRLKEPKPPAPKTVAEIMAEYMAARKAELKNGT